MRRLFGYRGPEAPYAQFAWVAAGAIALLYIVPMTGLFLLSLGIPGQPGVAAYADIASSTAVRNVIAVTLRIACVTTVVSVVLGYVLALGVTHLHGTARTALLVTIVIPFWLSALVRSLAWLILLRNNGLVNESLLSLGLVAQPLQLARNEIGVVIAMVHFCVPYATLPLLAATNAIDRRHIMAARSMGASQLRVLRDVVLPLTVPAIIASGLLVFVFCLGFFVTPAIIGGGRVVMVSEYVSLSVLVTLRWALAAALSIAILAASLMLVWAVGRMIGFRRLMEIG